MPRALTTRPDQLPALRQPLDNALYWCRNIPDVRIVRFKLYSAVGFVASAGSKPAVKESRA